LSRNIDPRLVLFPILPGHDLDNNHHVAERSPSSDGKEVQYREPKQTRRRPEPAHSP